MRRNGAIGVRSVAVHVVARASDRHPTTGRPELERQRALTVRDRRYRANVRLAAWLVILTVGVIAGAGGLLEAGRGGAPGCFTAGGADRAAPPKSRVAALAAVDPRELGSERRTADRASATVALMSSDVWRLVVQPGGSRR